MEIFNKWKMFIIDVLLVMSGCINTAESIKQSRREIDFGFDWKFHKGDLKQAINPRYDDSSWRWLPTRLRRNGKHR